MREGEAGGETRGDARERRASPGGAPPLGLLRLREAGIVRLCGLTAASQGLDLAARRALSQLRRDGPRLSALAAATGDAPAIAVWFDVILAATDLESLTLAGVRWGCDAHITPGSENLPTAQGCEHVAALLSAWVRAPGDFHLPAAPQAEPSLAPESVHTSAIIPPDAVSPPDAPRAPKIARPGPRPPTNLGDELRRLPERDLQALARRTLGVEALDAPTPEQTRATLATLESTLRDPETVARLLGRLEPEVGETLAWLRLAGGALTVAGMHALAGRTGRPLSALSRALAALERHGLVFPTLLPGDAPAQPSADRDRSWRGVSGWRIAPETRAALPRDLPIQPLSRTELTAERPRVERSSSRALLLALTLVGHAPPPLGPLAPRERDAAAPLPTREQPGRRDRFGAALTPEDLPEPARLAAARAAGLSPDAARLARRVTLWRRDDRGADGSGFAPNALGALGGEIAASARLRAFQAAFTTWRVARSPAELVDLERVTGTVRMRYDHTHEAFSPAALADEAAAARGWITRLLGYATPGAWYLADDLIELVWRVNPYFLRGKQLTWRTPAWRLERVSDGRPLRPNIREDWFAAEGAYLRTLLSGPLRLWGALDVSRDGAGAPRLFRLTPLGAALLARPPRDGASAPAPGAEAAARALTFDWGPVAALTKEGALAVQPLAAPPAVIAALDQWAEVTSLAGGRLLYTFTPARALARFDEGLTADRALAPLRAAGLARVAQAIEPRLAGWRQGYGDAKLTAGLVIIEGRDEATLREALAAIPGLAARARRIGPAVVALTPADAGILRAALAKKGWEL